MGSGTIVVHTNLKVSVLIQKPAIFQLVDSMQTKLRLATACEVCGKYDAVCVLPDRHWAKTMKMA